MNQGINEILNKWHWAAPDSENRAIADYVTALEVAIENAIKHLAKLPDEDFDVALIIDDLEDTLA